MPVITLRVRGQTSLERQAFSLVNRLKLDVSEGSSIVQCWPVTGHRPQALARASPQEHGLLAQEPCYQGVVTAAPPCRRLRCTAAAGSTGTTRARCSGQMHRQARPAGHRTLLYHQPARGKQLSGRTRDRKALRGCLLIGYLHGGKAVYSIARDVKGAARESHKHLKPPHLSAIALFNADALDQARGMDPGCIDLTEGELDAASLIAAYGEDCPVLGLSGGLLGIEASHAASSSRSSRS